MECLLHASVTVVATKQHIVGFETINTGRLSHGTGILLLCYLLKAGAC